MTAGSDGSDEEEVCYISMSVSETPSALAVAIDTKYLAIKLCS